MAAMIRPEDESFHPHGGDPFWNESAWFPLMIPERRASGWVYFFHRPGMGLSVGGVALWDLSGERHVDCLYYDWGDLLPLPEGADMYDFVLPNGLSSECVEPLSTFRLAYKGDGCELDLTWQGVREPRHSGLPKGSDEWGSSHFEQCGRMTGAINVGGEELTVDCWSNRDHSWGRRRFVSNPRGDFPWAVASEDAGFHTFAVSELPREADPIVGTSERIIFGWYLKDGVAADVVAGTRRVVERGDDGRPMRLVVDGADALGRTLHAEGQCRNWLQWQGYPFMFQWWCHTEWEFDGHVAYGEVQDFFPIQQKRRFVRALGQEVR